jgi:rhodanese-related sulfurtransferase
MQVIANPFRAFRWFALRRFIRTTFPEVEQLSTGDLSRILESSVEGTVLLLDTRRESEFAVSHLEGAVRLDPDTEDDDLAKIADRKGPVVTYCSVGYRSSGVARRLLRAGCEDVRNLEGSIFKWANEGRAVVRDGRAAREVHPFNESWGKLLREELRAERPK